MFFRLTFPFVVSSLSVIACFGRVTVVPAAEAPKPPTGSGWQCFEAIAPARGPVPSQAKHTVHCKREQDACTRAADGYRKDPAFEHVTTCSPREAAFCSATFTSESDAAWSCFAALEDCQAQVGGVAGAPGTKQSECAQLQ